LSAEPRPYRVLARAYRPTRLSELVGQEALVRSLTNAFSSGRIAQAYLLTGIRGTGKTTTARLIAKCLNCVGADGLGGVTPEPCNACEPCRAIAEDRHIDVLEIDAATNNGIEHVRDLVDNARYAPADGRYKVYIIDEVHMLSQASFNGLLKTLEEPPPHARFVLATTEVRKLPVTVLSRCQRYDLRRIEPAVLQAHLADVATREEAAAEPQALALIARVAGGSARDGLSLLDQAITLGEGRVEVDGVRAMLGLVDRRYVNELFGHIAHGEPAAALILFRELMAAGGDPKTVVEDLLTLIHDLTRDKLDGGTAAGADERTELAAGLELPVLARAWQVLLKGLDEVGQAPDGAAAAEMLLVRLALMGDLPPPAELMRRLEAAEAGTPAGTAPSATGAPPNSLPAEQAHTQPAPTMRERVPQEPTATSLPPMPRDLEGIVALLSEGGYPRLAAWLRTSARPATVEPGRLRLAWCDGAPAEAGRELATALHALTGRRWGVDHASSDAPTLAEREEATRRARIAAAHDWPQVRRVLEKFPGARVVGFETRRADDVASPPPRQEGSLSG